MKALLLSRTWLALLLAISVLASCRKSEVEPEPNAATTLAGRWQLLQTSGGIAGGTYPADPNRKRELVLTADGKATFLLNGGVEVPTGYRTKRQYSAYTGREENIIVFEAPLSSYHAEMVIAELTSTRLSLQETYADGQRYDYVRL